MIKLGVSTGAKAFGSARTATASAARTTPCASDSLPGKFNATHDRPATFSTSPVSSKAHGGARPASSSASNKATSEVRPTHAEYTPKDAANTTGRPILHQFTNHKVLPATHNPGQIISTKFGNISLTEQGVKDFMVHNFERFERKLRKKVALGEIPGFDKFNSTTREQLKTIVSDTLSSVKHVTEGHFAKIGTKHAVVDIYSHQTGYTVRMVSNAQGAYTFETIMAGKTTAVHLTEFMTYAAKRNNLG